jgi:hypothetical protein
VTMAQCTRAFVTREREGFNEVGKAPLQAHA